MITQHLAAVRQLLQPIDNKVISESDHQASEHIHAVESRFSAVNNVGWSNEM